MELTVLGSSGSFPTADECCSGFLLRHDGYTVWLDAGSGTISALQRHIPLNQVDAIVLSHRHLDHSADIHMWFHAHYTMELPVVPVVAPPDCSNSLASVSATSRELFLERMDWTDLSPGASLQLGPFNIEAFASQHSAPNNAMRISADGTTMCYSGDTGPNDDLITAAREADLFLCEATWLAEQAGVMEPVHMTCGEAGATARDAGAARLVLTHLWPGNDRARSREQAADAYGREVELAAEMETITV